MRKLHVRTILLAFFLSGCKLGIVVGKICSAGNDDCQTAGKVDGVGDKNEVIGEVMYRTYYCNGSKTLNIPETETFLCCRKTNEIDFKWRLENNSSFVAGKATLRCEAKVECTGPPEPSANMERNDLSRYMTLPSEKYYDGDTVEYKCQEGYEWIQEGMEKEMDYYYYYYDNYKASNMNLSSTITCNQEGRWVDNETNSEYFDLGKCQEISCDASHFENMTYGVILNYTTVYKYGEYLTLVCDDGYMANDYVDTVMCESPDSFSQENLPDFRCQAIRCPDVPEIENGAAYGVSQLVNGTATFSCHNGYTLSGQRVWRCKENGDWDNYCVRCNRKDTYCPAPCVPEGAILLNPMPTYPEGAMINFVCIMNVTYGGSPERVCLRNRQWSGNDIDCIGQSSKSSTVSRLLNALHNMTEPENQLLAASEAQGKSIDLHQSGGVDISLLVDISGSISDIKFNATKMFINTLLPRLKISRAKHGTRLALYMFASEVEEVWNDHSFLYTKSTEQWQQLVNDLKRKDIQIKTKKGTAFTNALRKIKRELETKQKRWDDGDLRIAQQVLIVLSDGFNNMGGDSKELARKLKDKHNLEIYSICVQPREKQGNIGVDFMRTLASEDVDEHFFLLPSNSENGYLHDIISSMINEGPGCADCGCTIPERTQYKSETNQHHSDALRNAWPWMVQLRRGNVHVCGGTVITEKWILTAAHCFDDKTETYKIDFKRLKRNDDVGVETIESKSVHIHKKYNPTQEPKFLYDIALVYLGRDNAVEFDVDLHAICLGDKDDIDYYKQYQSGQYGVVTGWGEKGHDAKSLSNGLKQMQMKIQTNETCSKKYGGSKQYNTTLMFCGGGNDGQGNVIDTCKGDSGGPFVVPYGDEVPGKKNHFVQIGIVSFGFGCMKEGSYGAYTRLSPELLQWIDDTVKLVENQA